MQFGGADNAGDTVSDAGPDVAAAHIDISEISISLSSGTLTVVFHLSDLPDTLTSNRAAQGMKEYGWEVASVVDNGRSSGRGGFDVLPTAYHIVWASGERRNGTAPIGEILRSGVWGIDANGSASEFAGTSLEACPEADTITLASVTDPQS